MAKLKKKLLAKSTMLPFLYLSLLLLLVATPIFYFALQNLYEEETNDALETDLIEFNQFVSPKLHQEDVADWNRFSSHIQLTKSNTIIKPKYTTKNIYNSIEDEDEAYRILQSNVLIDGQNYIFVARHKLVENIDLFESIVLLFVFLTLFLLVGQFLLNRYISKRLWLPFYDTLEQIESFNINENNILVTDDKGIEEFERLNNTIEKWLARNAEIFNAQKEFIENAAHELQTPLAVFKAKIENLCQIENTTDEQYKLLEELNSTVDKLSRLNKNLLLYARVDNQQYNQSEPISLKEIIYKNLDFYKDQAISKEVEIYVEIEEDVNLEANLFMVETLFNNLVINAIRHNIQNGKVNIGLRKNVLIISNTGIDLPIKSRNLYKRFANTSSSNQGTGLGLAIVKKIVDLNFWTINYTHQNSLHSFTVSFS